MTRHHYRIVSPIRFFFFILICIMIIVFTASTMISAGRSEAASVNTYAQVVISENDTLWDIACRYNPDYRDIRGIIHEIYEANDMTAADIIPGEVIFVPIH